MLSENIQVTDIHADHWRRFLSLLSHPLPSIGSEPSRLPVLLFLEKGQLIKALRIGDGPLKRFSWEGPSSLPALCQTLHASWIAVVEVETLSSLLKSLESQWRFGNDYLFDVLTLIQSFRAKIGQGVYLYPRLLANLPIPSYEVWRRIIDFLLPDGRCIVFYLFEKNSVWTSVIIGKNQGVIDLLTTHNALSLPNTVENWKQETQKIVRAVEEKVLPVHIAFFSERKTWQKLVTTRDRGAWAKAVHLETVLLEPSPHWIRALLGAGRLLARVSQEIEKHTGDLGNLWSRGTALGNSVGGMIGRAAVTLGVSSARIELVRTFLKRRLGFDPFAPESPLRFLAVIFHKAPEETQPESEDRT